MSEQNIKDEIIKVSKEALELVSQISSLWDSSISEYVRSELKQAA